VQHLVGSHPLIVTDAREATWCELYLKLFETASDTFQHDDKDHGIIMPETEAGCDMKCLRCVMLSVWDL
jgi:hypothetical protein